MFDGLDEVPGDVKDQIASQILSFSENVLSEVNSDSLIICTSRPQGYAGQFDALAPALVDLAQLNAEEALACALPVLAVDRSVEELARYSEVLRDAMTSAAIREIMTTPLQSHIMAVVVRDGGRPPERRWQLFSNFYQVIKKREANRNLPDKSIARLLREGDKLIKTLHNRLGFELHARAEVSSGAQTSIETDELRAIVEEVVSSLQDTDVEQTVETLMLATTERLVLVSTPESGSSVRFHIRPLQEFFAAEYLYQSAPDSGFFERIQLIGGDSHWREVMHFLLSALIEQDRTTQLAQAVQVLINLDNPLEERERPLARSLFKGGILVARLLREGVLEADKRIRHQFHPCMSALLAATDAISALPMVSPPHSRDWLANAISLALIESSPTENIGAATIAPRIMVSDSPLDKSVADLLFLQSPDYRRTFWRKALSKYIREEKKIDLPDWLVGYAVKELSSHTWFELGSAALDSCYTLIGGNQDRAVRYMSQEGVEVEYAERVVHAFANEGREGARQATDEKLFGLISVTTSSGP